MEFEKENKRLKVLIIILLVFLVAFGGYYFYENVILANNVDNEKANDIITSEEEKINTELLSRFVGSYSYIGEYVDSSEFEAGKTARTDKAPDEIITEEQKEKWSYVDIILNLDGTAKISGGNLRASGYSLEGKWYISDDELIAVDNHCSITDSTEIVDGLCTDILVYKYKFENDNVIIVYDNIPLTKNSN